MKEKKPVNDEIRVSRVKVVGEDGKVIGEMSLEEAKKVAEEKEKDLMLVMSQGDFWVVKLIDYGKYLYEEKKKEKRRKQKTKEVVVKTIRISFGMSDHDLEIRKNQAKKFFEEECHLKILLPLRGRENIHEQLANEKLLYFIESLKEFYTSEKWPVKIGNSFVVTLIPKKK